jgi:hypothetical protein
LQLNCNIRISGLHSGPNTAKDKKAFYSPTDSILADDPDLTQDIFRNKFIDKISDIPAPEYTKLSPDEFNKEIYELTKNNSNPTSIRLLLAKFYRRKLSNLQHKKYKLL